MKKLLSIIIFSSSCFPAFATIRTVSNSDSAAQYRTIQDAIDASVSGDSIYVGGSTVAYPLFKIDNKKIAVFGPGWSPDKTTPYTANVAGCYITNAGAAGSEIHGLIFTSNVSVSYPNTGISINGLSFIRNKFQSIVYFYAAESNYLFEGNWFDNGALADVGYAVAYSNFIIHNNIFYSASSYGAGGLNGTNIWFDHNLWYGPSSGSADCFSGCQFLTITNNIFVRRNAANTNTSSSFQNNITYQCINDTPWKSNGNRNDSGNIAGKDPKMVDDSSVLAGIDNPLLDFTIPSGSPANNKGNDGKDMGLLYGTDRVNWTRSRGANLPFVYKMTITNSSVPVGGNLQVTVDAKSN
jgi:hypothetical protein